MDGRVHSVLIGLTRLVDRWALLSKDHAIYMYMTWVFCTFNYSGASFIRTPLIQVIHLSGHMFGNQLCLCIEKWLICGYSLMIDDLGTNYVHILRRDSFIRIFSYPDSWLGNQCVMISESSLYMIWVFCTLNYVLNFVFLKYCGDYEYNI